MVKKQFINGLRRPTYFPLFNSILLLDSHMTRWKSQINCAYGFMDGRVVKNVDRVWQLSKANEIKWRIQLKIKKAFGEVMTNYYHKFFSVE